MFRSHPFGGVAIAFTWVLASALYYYHVHLPPDINVFTNLVCCGVAAVAIVALPTTQMILKTYLVAFSAAIGLSSLQVGEAQLAFSREFLVFLTLHLTILGVFICVASLPPARVGTQAKNATLANWAVFAFIAIGAYVASVKGVRLSSFLDGVKTGGNLYKASGLSGVQGILSVFLLCCFSLLTPWKKALFLGAVLVFAVLDVKRGEFIRVAMFLTFFFAIQSPKKTVWIFGFGALIFAAFVITGEARQGLYTSDFSVSDMLHSRIRNTAFDWAYGYFGITVSVLQEYFNSPVPGAGYFPVISSLVTNSAMPDISSVSIGGFNAGTAFSIFAGEGQSLPTWDFLGFCAIVAMMVASAKWLQTPSVMAFVMLQVFGFVFGNMLMLPYYLVGFAGAVVYLAGRPGPSAARRGVQTEATASGPISL